MLARYSDAASERQVATRDGGTERREGEQARRIVHGPHRVETRADRVGVRAGVRGFSGPTDGPRDSP